MKIIIFIWILASFITGCSDDRSVTKNNKSKEIVTTSLKIKNGIAFLPDKNEPYTGKIVFYFPDNICVLYKLKIDRGAFFEDHKEATIYSEESWLSTLWRNKQTEQKCVEISFKDGKGNGVATAWDNKGRKEYEKNYKEGKLNGLSISWWESGGRTEINYKDGKKNGSTIEFDKNGQKKRETNYKDGEINGLDIAWDENGQKSSEVIYKKENGLSTIWNKNGQNLGELKCVDGNCELKTSENENQQKKSGNMQQIISRCRTQMGEHGAAMVKACVDQDKEAFQALANDTYLEKHKDILSRCLTQMEEHGYAMVKACADQDIEAEEALGKY